MGLWYMYTLCQAFLECEFQAYLSYICVFLPLDLFLIKRKNYPTLPVHDLHYTKVCYILIIYPWISVRGFNVEDWPSLFLLGAMKFDLDKVIWKIALIFLFWPPLPMHIRRITYKFPFRRTTKHFFRLVNFSYLIIRQRWQCILPVSR